MKEKKKKKKLQAGKIRLKKKNVLTHSKYQSTSLLEDPEDEDVENFIAPEEKEEQLEKCT